MAEKGAPPSRVRSLTDIISKLMQPALTSHYECYFDIPNVKESGSKSQGTVTEFINKAVPVTSETNQLLTLSCSEASLPGSSLATHDLNNDFTGVTQKHVYRRIYDDRADFTFYVNSGYAQIRLFERWMQFISGEQQDGAENLNNSYRVKYPQSYKTTIYITKFERDLQKNPSRLSYSFFNAFPIAVNSMPISYDSSQLLKCTVSFAYDRYITENKAGTVDPTSAGNAEEQSIFNSKNIYNYQNNLGLDFGYKPSDFLTNTSPNQFNLEPLPGNVGGRTGAGFEVFAPPDLA